MTIPQLSKRTFADRYLYWSRSILTVIVWISACAFGLYIIGFYIAGLLTGNLSSWNTSLPDIYEKGEPTATAGITLHFVMGAIILTLGTVQFIPVLRLKYPAVHRILGRVYVIASLLTALGGLIFIVMSGTVGGMVMNIAFSLYGVLMIVSAVETARHARAKRIIEHNNWALRLYVLGIASWLYRMMYGIWGLLADYRWHTDNWTGGFDYFMDFAFYVPSLIIVELIIRSRQRTAPKNLKIITASILSITILFLAAATYFAILRFWLPGVRGLLGI